MSRLILVSNRVPRLSTSENIGGLVVALEAALARFGGLWFGWSGEIVDSPEREASVENARSFDLVTIDFTPAEVKGYYEQFSNQTLWPHFHGRLDLCRFDHHSRAVYQQVNRRFGAELHPRLMAGDIVWVHDYHLIPLGAELRRLGIAGPIGFFLHIPFPSADCLAALPWHRELLEELCAYDLVGFQTEGCVRNFIDCVKQYAEGSSNIDGQVSIGGRRLKVASFPIGIDTAAFESIARSDASRLWGSRLRLCSNDQTWIVGVERLDYTKGLVERFKAFERLLDQAPDLHGRVSLLQIAAPSRVSVAEYQQLQATLEALSGRINGRFGTFEWTPIRYLNRSFDHDQLTALYRICRVGLVTSLRDGMNLVAKEYVAAQDPADPGVLVLSCFAGAADELKDALIVNPYDIERLAQKIRTALRMPLAERHARWRRMMSHLELHDVHSWCRDYLDALVRAHAASSAATQAA